MERKACIQVRIAVRRASRHPAIRTGVFLRRHVVRGATLGIVPDALNDVAFHHAQLNMNEIVHVIQDVAATSTMSAALATLLILAKVQI